MIPDLGPSEDYYLFSDALPEDKELRQQLQRRRLVRGERKRGERERERERERVRVRERGVCGHRFPCTGGHLGDPTS